MATAGVDLLVRGRTLHALMAVTRSCWLVAHHQGPQMICLSLRGLDELDQHCRQYIMMEVLDEIVETNTIVKLTLPRVAAMHVQQKAWVSSFAIRIDHYVAAAPLSLSLSLSLGRCITVCLRALYAAVHPHRPSCCSSLQLLHTPLQSRPYHLIRRIQAADLLQVGLCILHSQTRDHSNALHNMRDQWKAVTA